MGRGAFKTEGIVYTKALCQAEAFQIERLKSHQCHQNKSEGECVKGGCRGKWGPEDAGF